MPKCSTEAIQKVIRKNGKAACCLWLAILHIKSPLPSLFPFFWRFSAQSIHQFAALSWTLQMPQMKHFFHLLCTTRFISFQLVQFAVSSVETTCLLCRSLRPEGKPSALSWFATEIFKRIDYGSEIKTEENSQDAHMSISNPETFPTS